MTEVTITGHQFNYLLRGILIEFSACKLLLVHRFQHFRTTADGWLDKGLPFPELQQSAAFLKLLFVLFKRFIYVLAIF